MLEHLIRFLGFLPCCHPVGLSGHSHHPLGAQVSCREVQVLQSKQNSPPLLILSLLWLREETLGNSRGIQQQLIKSSSLPPRAQSFFLLLLFWKGKKSLPNSQASRGTQNTRAVVFLSHVVIIIRENSVQSKQTPFQSHSSATNSFEKSIFKAVLYWVRGIASVFPSPASHCRKRDFKMCLSYEDSNF